MLEKFHFEKSDGTTVEVPYLMDSISPRKMKKLQKEMKQLQVAQENGDADEDAEMPDEVMMEAALGKKFTDDVMDNWTMRDYTEFVKGWSNATQEDISVGESSGSGES